MNIWLYVWKTPFKKQNAAEDKPGSGSESSLKNTDKSEVCKEAGQLLSYAKKQKE